MVNFFNKDFLSKIITFVFFIWLLLTLVGTINDPNLVPWGLTHNVLRLFILLFIFIFLYKKWLYKFKNKLLILFLIFGFVYQLIVILSGVNYGFSDTWVIHSAVLDLKPWKWYVKSNPNNLFAILFQSNLLNFFHLNKSVLSANLINLVCIDISFLLNIFIVNLINREYLKNIALIEGTLMFSLPHIISPYTDTMCLPFVSMYILGIVIIKKNYHNNIYKTFLGLILFSFGSIFSYQMKPSTLVPILSIILLCVFYYSKNIFSKTNFKKNILIFLVPLVVFSFGIFSMKYIQKDVLNIDLNGEYPMSHFAAMGITNHGGFNHDITTPIDIMHTKKEKDDYSKKIIVKQLNDYGALGYIQFLINKNYANTSDGTFNWNRTGGFESIENKSFFPKKIKNFFQNIYHTDGKYSHDFQFIDQLLWIGMVSLLVLGTCRVDEFTQLFRIALMGGLTFLLIFEGGRSRYIIQFLPIIIILNSITLNFSLNLIKKIKLVIEK